MTARPRGRRTLDRVEILLWLVPSAVVTLVAMVWAWWAGRERDHEVDPEVAAARLERALTRPRRLPGYAVPEREQDRSTGIAVRPSRRAS